ncbi:MAG: HlyC/CorC family transporter [Rhodospirillaceae bacterium]
MGDIAANIMGWLNTEIVLTSVAIIVLLILSAFFSGSETALTAASRARLHQLAKAGNRRAESVEALRDNPSSLIGAILIGNNITNISASALATSMLIAVFGEAGVVYATIAMTILVVIFAEILPKTYAINRAENAALAVVPLVRLLVWIIHPINRVTSILVIWVLRLGGVRVSATLGHDESEAELRGMIDLHEGPDQDAEHERQMLRSILDLGDVWIEDVMTHRSNVVMLEADTPIGDLIQQVIESPYTRVPLWHEHQDNIIGVLHAKSLLRALRDKTDDEIAEIQVLDLASQPWFVPETTSLLDQLQAFRSRREHFATVIDEYGAFMGIITLEDILEEIVGDIVDEHDVAVAGVRPQSDGTLLVDGTVTIRDLNREFDWSLPDEAASTIAGLVLHESRRIPEIAQEFRFHGIQFKILRRSGNRITLMRLVPPNVTIGAAARTDRKLG